MQTDDLIASLAADLDPVTAGADMRRLLTALALGAVVSFVLMLGVYGLRSDFIAASVTPPFWIKWAFTLGIAASSFPCVRTLGRPEGRIGLGGWLLAIPFILALGLAGLELAPAAPADRSLLVIGHTALRCTLAILLLALPVFALLVWAFRKLAPTRPALTGAFAGVLSAGVGASVYAFACPETTASFMITWYTLAVVATAVFGAAIGKLTLRW